MDDTEQATKIIKRAIRKHWKNGGKIVFRRWGVTVKKGKWVAGKNCCALACVLDGKAALHGSSDNSKEYDIKNLVDHGLEPGNFVHGFDSSWDSIPNDRWIKMGNEIRDWVKKNQSKK